MHPPLGPTKESLAQTLANRLEAEWAREPVSLPPPARTLARLAGVSYVTALTALRLLREKGLIDFRRGSRIRPAGKVPSLTTSATGAALESTPPSPDPGAAARDLRSHLRIGLRNGIYRQAEALPKRAVLSRHFGVSPATVGAAYRELEQEGLLFRLGRRFIVGMEAPGIPLSTAQSVHAGTRAEPIRPVILVAVPTPRSWEAECTNKRTGDFGQSFVRESQRRGIQIRLVAMGSTGSVGPTAVADGFSEYGLRGMAQLAHSLGSLYLGLLLPVSRARAPELPRWVAAGLRLGKPVVWFDKNDEGLAANPRSGSFTRLHHCEKAAASAVLEYAASLGHRKLFYPCWIGTGWELERYVILRREAERMGRDMEVVMDTAYVASDWSTMGTDFRALLRDTLRAGYPGYGAALQFFEASENPRSLKKLLREAEREGWGKLEDLRPYAALVAHTRRTAEGHFGSHPPEAYRVWDTLRLNRCLSDPGFTLLLAPNDTRARFHLRCLRELGVAVPERLSVLSFDNELRYLDIPLSSLDFGFGDLGYQAFQRLAVPDLYPRQRTEHDAIRPRVIDRGSVAIAQAGNSMTPKTVGRTWLA